MHCTVSFLDEYPLPDNFELKAFMLTLVCLFNPFQSELREQEMYIFE